MCQFGWVPEMVAEAVSPSVALMVKIGGSWLPVSLASLLMAMPPPVMADLAVEDLSEPW
jgi:hypothetical protein